ncbi:MAG: serine/threonine protein kinase [Spirulinaceae cyanobacterium]
MASSASADLLLGNRYQQPTLLRETAEARWLRVIDTHQDDQPRLIQQLRVPCHQSARQEQVIQQCQQEFAFLQRLQHPQVPRFFDFWPEQRPAECWLNVVQSAIAGPSLRQWLHDRAEQAPFLNELAVAKLLLHLLNGVGYLHSQGVIHRQLSPDTLQLDPAADRWCLTEFGGMQQALNGLQTEAVGDITTHPASADAGAALDYAPLEQVQKGILYTYSDIYAIAATIMYALTGEPPSAWRDPYTGAWDWDATPLHCPELQGILARMLAKKPSDRPQNVQGIIHMLRRIPRDSLLGAIAAQTTARENPTAKTKTAPLKTTPSKTPRPATPRATAKTASPNSLQTTPGLGQAAAQLSRWTLRLALGLGFVAAAAAIGWGVGQTWLGQTAINPDTFPDFDLSPDPTGAADQAQAQDFPLIEDGEPDPDESWSEAEQSRRRSLRDQRRQLGINYEVFRALVQYAYGQDYAAAAGVVTTVDGPREREQWDRTAQRLLNQLASLSGDARRRLGRYPDATTSELAGEAVAPATLETLTAIAFASYFPDGSPESPPLQQLWRAIAFDQARSLQQEGAIEALAEPLSRTGQLEPGQGKIYTLELAAGQTLTATLASDYTTAFAVQAPTGELLLDPEGERVWSGRIAASGQYSLILMNTFADPVDFKIGVAIE